MSVGRVDSLVVKVAERCNLNCTYCYMYNHADQSWLRRPKIMSDEVFERLLDRMEQHCAAHPGHRMSFTFHGGEPMLIGKRRLARYARRARERLGSALFGMGMQTNGTLVDDEWVDVLREAGIRTGVSLDGPPNINDAARVDHRGRGSHDAAVEGLLKLRDGGVFDGVLCVINPEFDGLEVYDYFRSLGLTWISFLFPDVTHDSRERLYGRFGRTPVADYLIPIFDSWFSEDDPSVHIRLFWDILRQMLGGKSRSDAFGNGPLGYVVIETDGAIQPVDTLRACEDGMIESGLNLSRNGFDDLHLGPPLLHKLVAEGLPLCATCRACPDLGACGGGYPTHRYSRLNRFDNPSAWCEDIRKLVGHMRSRIHPVWRQTQVRSSSLRMA
jgi:uncharacterized protein